MVAMTIGAVSITMIVAAAFNVAAIWRLGMSDAEQRLRLLCEVGENTPTTSSNASGRLRAAPRHNTEKGWRRKSTEKGLPRGNPFAMDLRNR